MDGRRRGAWPYGLRYSWLMHGLPVLGGDPWAIGYRAGRRAVLRSDDGVVAGLDVSSWHGAPTPDEEALLDRAVAPVLDIGCGPGRLLGALRARGVTALGIDTSPMALRRAVDHGLVLDRSVFAPLPLEGHWKTVLLLDGNLGIGGDPVALLERVAELLDDEGRALVEAGPPGCTVRRVLARVEGERDTGPWFPWAEVGCSSLPTVAERAGLAVTELWQVGDRWFAELVPVGRHPAARAATPSPNGTVARNPNTSSARAGLATT